MIGSVLIANRGEIACRIIETCRKLGVRTVAVYSDADAGAKHVRDADEAVHIGPAPASESYLNSEAIIAAAKASSAEAIHPGYGFLSENTAFASAVTSAGLIWIGPKAETIEAMGLKDEAKRLAEAAGVPVLPGYRGEDQSLKTLEAAAKEIGFPLLIKAIAGGGGRGIREVHALKELKPQLESAQREALSAFGDDRVMLEKLVEQPRHIEVQVLGESHGNAVQFFERDCSFQRRRQKVIEEAPSPGMLDDVRAAMTAAAVDLAKSVAYEGAGTVEFIVDGSGPLTLGSYWFLEMNTRLQVEHPVTEMITGVDLVEWQLRVASGEPLPLKQDQIEMKGHAIEARICAEDPANAFRPGFGRLDMFDLSENIRLDFGFQAGDTVPADYDSMIGKAIAYGDNREGAIEALSASLSSAELYPIANNIGFLRRCLTSDRFRAGDHHVNWIAENMDDLVSVPDTSVQSALQAVAQISLMADGGSPWQVNDGWRVNAAPRISVPLAIGDQVHSVDITRNDPFLAAGLITELDHDRFGVTVEGDTFVISKPNYEAAAEALEAGDDITAPMPGKLLSVAVAAGDTVSAGQVLVVMEAMKMEHALSSPRDGTIAELNAIAGEQVNEGKLLVRLEESE